MGDDREEACRLAVEAALLLRTAALIADTWRRVRELLEEAARIAARNSG